ncbi:MAG: radical SAM protein [Spirochaetales bacterium]|nr:radical SAM protein [Spirochaetales bacterium]
MYKHLFGPVPSRRLGMSLGIDLVPCKTCSLDCIYCEVGATTNLTVERKEYVSFEEVKNELIHYFDTHKQAPDYITFSGSGEPTLNSRIGDIIDFIKEIKPEIKLAVLTNGTLLSNQNLRRELLGTHIVLPSLDAASNDIFKAINRQEKSLNVEQHIQGLVDFRKEYNGKIFLEVFILPGINDSTDHLKKLKEAIKRISPDKIQLNTLDRPGVVRDLRTASKSDLEKIAEKLDFPYREIIADVEKRKNVISYREDAESAIWETIARRPCTLDDLSKILGMHINEINKYLDCLQKDNKIEVVPQDREFSIE